jgi:hypothetical protein
MVRTATRHLFKKIPALTPCPSGFHFHEQTPTPSSLSKRGDYPPTLPPIGAPFPVEL